CRSTIPAGSPREPRRRSPRIEAWRGQTMSFCRSTSRRLRNRDRDMSEAKQSRYTPVPIEINGRRYVLRYTWGRLRDLRDRTDGRLDILGRGLRGATADDFPILLWAGISHARDGGDPALEPGDVEAMLADVDLAEYEALDRA